MNLIETTEAFVSRILGELSDDYKYHDRSHTFEVRDACVTIGKAMDLSSTEMEIIELAALFHDTGFLKTYNGHEYASQEIAREFLEKQDYPPPKLEQVLACIEATIPTIQARNTMEEVIRDADLVHVSRKDYLDSLADLRYEWSLFLNRRFGEEEWFELNADFLKTHQFNTTAAESLYGKQKKKNRKALKKMANEMKSTLPEMASSFIKTSKSAQMMFKTALRNHLDLSSLADNKANIMLSVNALIITIAAPIAGSYISTNRYLIIPLAALLVTCLASMIYATLATRPIKMSGITPIERVKTGGSNLFFFGNFYKMKYDDYKAGMGEVLLDDHKLDDAIMRDLYYLGKSLGTKYSMLRTCYTIFMVGIIATVIIFGLTYSFLTPS